MIVGWQIWEWPDVLAEAEYHAVWESPKGEWLDITPKDDGVDRILFLPDHGRPYKGRRKDSKRMALNGNPVSKVLIAASERIFRLTSAGESIDRPGLITLVGEDLAEYERLALQHDIARRMLLAGGGMEHECLCGSRLEYESCCAVLD